MRSVLVIEQLIAGRRLCFQHGAQDPGGCPAGQHHGDVGGPAEIRGILWVMMTRSWTRMIRDFQPALRRDRSRRSADAWESRDSAGEDAPLYIKTWMTWLLMQAPEAEVQKYLPENRSALYVRKAESEKEHTKPVDR